MSTKKKGKPTPKRPRRESERMRLHEKSKRQTGFGGPKHLRKKRP